MQDQVLTRLLRGEHLSMDERIQEGVWPHPSLAFDSVLKHLISLLECERWFPHEWKQAVDGECADEQPCIEQRRPGQFIGHAQSSRPDSTLVVLYTTEIAFKNVEDAARWYLTWALHLPGDLDGWKVV